MSGAFGPMDQHLANIIVSIKCIDGTELLMRIDDAKEVNAKETALMLNYSLKELELSNKQIAFLETIKKAKEILKELE